MSPAEESADESENARIDAKPRAGPGKVAPKNDASPDGHEATKIDEKKAEEKTETYRRARHKRTTPRE